MNTIQKYFERKRLMRVMLIHLRNYKAECENTVAPDYTVKNISRNMMFAKYDELLKKGLL